MATSSKISRSRVDSLPPRKHQLLLCTELTISNGSTKPSRMSFPMKFAECCTAKLLPSPSYLFCLVPSSHLSHTVYMTVQVAFIHSCIHSSIFSWIYTFMRTQRICIYNINSHMVASIAHSLFRQYSSGSVLDHFKWQVPTNEQLEPFQKCHTQCVWSRDVTNQSFQVATPNKRIAWTLSKVSSPVCLV